MKEGTNINCKGSIRHQKYVCAIQLLYGGGTLGKKVRQLWGGLEGTHSASERHLGSAGREDDTSADGTVNADETTQ
jgi:hypothetical protein